MEPALKIYKIGGNVIDSEDALQRFLGEFSEVKGPKLLVHGGGKIATRMSKELGIQTQMIDGRRVTDAATIDIVTMVYAGLINKKVTAQLQKLGCNAIGLTGADANCVKAVKRLANPIDYGFVGDIYPDGVDADKILSFVNGGLTPVFCAINHDGNGLLLNCNADSVASALAIAMARVMPTELIFCFEKEGLLRDVDDPESVISGITHHSYKTLREEGVITDGMIPKVENALKAIDAGVKTVTIRSSKNILIPSGTTIKPD